MRERSQGRLEGGIAGLAVCVVAAVLLAFCSPPSGGAAVVGGKANDELLWLATFGDAVNGSHSRAGDQLVINWRARSDFRFDPQSPDGMAPAEAFDVDGLYQCDSTVNGSPATTLIDLTKVYLLDADNQPVTDLQLLDADEDVDLDLSFEVPPWPTVDDILYGDFAEDGPLVRLPAIRLSPEQRFRPSTDSFARDVTQLLELAPAGTQVGVDFALTPTMIYASGGEDPTPVPDGTVSSLFADPSAAEANGGLIWVADHPLPADDDESMWPTAINQSNSERGQSRPNGFVTPEYGHSLMVASSAAQTIPSSEIRVIDATDPTSRITVSALDAALKRAEVLNSGPAVLNLSFGAYDCDLSDLGLDVSLAASLEAVLGPYIEAPDITVVAAAGNDGSTDLFYPAALDGVQSVGATDATIVNTEACLAGDNEAWTEAEQAPEPDCRLAPEQLARFSNRPADLDLGAPGVDLILDYPTFEAGPDVVYEYLNNDDPMDRVTASLGQRVRMSGTSFAAPLVSACIAASQTDGVCSRIVRDSDIDKTIPDVG